MFLGYERIEGFEGMMTVLIYIQQFLIQNVFFLVFTVNVGIWRQFAIKLGGGRTIKLWV